MYNLAKQDLAALTIHESLQGEGAMPSFIFLYDAILSIDCSSAIEAGIVDFTLILIQVSVIKVGNLQLDKAILFAITECKAAW